MEVGGAGWSHISANENGCKIEFLSQSRLKTNLDILKIIGGAGRNPSNSHDNKRVGPGLLGRAFLVGPLCSANLNTIVFPITSPFLLCMLLLSHLS